MEILREAIVRLKNEQSMHYLVADQDAETIRLNRDDSSKDSCWYVELVNEKPEVVRLKSCQSGKYLCATDIPFGLDKPGKRVVQAYPQSQLDTSSIEWIPVKDSNQQAIKLKTSTGSFLNCNYSPSLKYFITHDTFFSAPLLGGFFWILDVPEMSPPYAFIDQESSFSKAGGHFSNLGEEGSSSVYIRTIKAVNRNRWSTLVLIINFIIKLRLLLKEAYKNQKLMKLHCYLFPSDYAFERETLVQLWMAAGYLRKGHMEEYGRRYFDILLNERLILPSKNDNIPGKYVANVGEVANGLNGILKFEDVDLLTVLKEEHIEAKGAKPWHVSLTSKDINQRTFETLKRFNELRTLLFVTNCGSSLGQLPADLFLALPCMEALDLSGSHITELPGSIGNMSQLRYLNLSFTLIESLPETICRLQELQTLNLEGCKRLYYLPKGFKKLINLRHLYFDVLGQLNFMPRDIGALTELRTLSAFIVDVEKGCNMKELRYMNNLSGSCCIAGLENITLQGAREASLSYKRLTRLQLRWNEYGDTDQLFYMEAISLLQLHPCLEELEILHYPYSKLPLWICAEKFKELCSITLRKCKVRRLDIRLGQLPNLKFLYIIQMDTVETIGRSIHAYGSTVSFPKLEKLTIEGMLILASWTGVRHRDFPMLTELSIKDCPNLKLLPFIPVLGSLKFLDIGKCTVLHSLSDQELPDKLETLMVDECPLLVMSYLENRAEWDKIKHVRHIWFDLEEMQSLSGDGADTSLMGEYRLLLSNFNQLDKYRNVSTAALGDVKACMIREEASFLENYGPEDEQKTAVSELRKLLEEINKPQISGIKAEVQHHKQQISGIHVGKADEEVQRSKQLIWGIRIGEFAIQNNKEEFSNLNQRQFFLNIRAGERSWGKSISYHEPRAVCGINRCLSIPRKNRKQTFFYYFLFPAIFLTLFLNKGFGYTY